MIQDRYFAFGQSVFVVNDFSATGSCSGFGSREIEGLAKHFRDVIERNDGGAECAFVEKVVDRQLAEVF